MEAESSGILNIIDNEMDKLQDEEGTQCRPAAPDFASKHLEDDRNLVGSTTSRTSGRKHRSQRGEGIIASSRDSDSRQRHNTDSVRVTPPRAARGTTVWLHRSRRPVDHTHAWSGREEHERPQTRRLSGRVECTQTTHALAPTSSEAQRLYQPRPPDGNHKEHTRREVVESARRVPQERHGTTVATTTRSRGESRRTRTPRAGQTHRRRVEPSKRAMECHGGRLMECHEDFARRT